MKVKIWISRKYFILAFLTYEKVTIIKFQWIKFIPDTEQNEDTSTCCDDDPDGSDRLHNVESSRARENRFRRKRQKADKSDSSKRTFWKI